MSDLASFQFKVAGRVWTCTEDADLGTWHVVSDCGVYTASADLTDHLADQVAALLGKLCPLIHAMGEARGAENMAQVLSQPRPVAMSMAERDRLWQDIVRAGQRIAMAQNPDDDRPDANAVVGIFAGMLAGMPLPESLRKQIEVMKSERAEVAA